MSKYFISVSVEAICKISDLASALQVCYANGADGNFEVLPSGGCHFMVIFERDADADGDYIRSKLANGGQNLSVVAMKQLGLELSDRCETSNLVEPVIEALMTGIGRCFDFENGALSSMVEASIEVA